MPVDLAAGWRSIVIRPCGYLENIWPLSASLIRKERRETIADSGNHLVVRDGTWEDETIKKGGALPHLRVAIQRINRVLIENLPQLVIDKVAIEQVLPRAATDWSKTEVERMVFAIITTTPPVRFYAAGASVHIPTADIVSIDPGDWWSVVNDSPAPHLHLMLSLAERNGKDQP